MRKPTKQPDMSAPDHRTQDWFNPETIRVEMGDGVSYYFDEEAVIALSGAPSHSTITAEIEDKSIHLSIEGPYLIDMKRRIMEHEKKGLMIQNLIFRTLPDYRKGYKLAARSLMVQATAAQGMDFTEIVADAKGDRYTAAAHDPENQWFGYSLLPRLGFDTVIPYSVRSTLRPPFEGCTMVSEILERPGGEAF